MMPSGRPRKNPLPSEERNDVDVQAEASTSATPTAMSPTTSSFSGFPIPPRPPSPHPDDMVIDMDDSISTPSGRRSSRRSARKVVSYRTQFDLDLSDEDDESGTPAKGKGSGRRRRAGSDQDSEDEFKPDADADGGANGQDSRDELEDDDEDEAESPSDDNDDEDDVATPRSRREVAKSSSKATPLRSNRKQPNSASRKPSRAASSKSAFPAHERRPALLPGRAIDGGFTAVDDVVQFSQIGKCRATTRSLQSAEAQFSAVEEVRMTWSTHNHYTQNQIGTKSSRSRDLAVLDTAWYPGKKTSLATEKKMRADVEQHWKSNGAHRSSLVNDVQVIGGVFLLPSTANDFKVVKGKEKARYTPPQPVCQPNYAEYEQQKDIQTFIEQDPIPRSQKGDFDVLMGLKDADGSQASFHIEKGKARALKDCNTTPGTNGFVASCGSFVSSIDWAPASVHAPAQPEYLAVGVQVTSPPAIVPRTVLGGRNKIKAPGVVQLWSLGESAEQKPELKLQYSLGIPLGEVAQVKWCPVGFDLREGTGSVAGSPPSRIGILACALTCGKVALFAMPRPEQVRSKSSEDDLIIELTPVLSLPVYAAEPTCLDWAGGERLLVGTTAGSLLVWHTGHLLRSLAGETPEFPVPPPPSHSFQIHETAVDAASWLHLPPRSTSISDAPTGTDGYDYSGLPHFVLTAGLDGSTRILDVDALDVSFESQKQREPLYATCFLSFLGTWISDRGDNAVRIINTRPAFLGRTHLIGSHQGRCTALDSSAFHPLLASGAADGTLTVLPTLKNVMRFEERINWPVYRLELLRGNGQLRYVDNYTTATYSHTAAASKGKGKNAGTAAGEQGTGTLGSFHPAIRITDVSWCKNLASNPFLLASGSACGLLRVDLIASDAGGIGGNGEDTDVDMAL